MTNKDGIWQSEHPWNFTEIGQNVRIENPSTNKTLFVVENSTAVNETSLAKNHSDLMWTKGVPNQEGYFTLTDPKTKMVLTAIDNTSLKITGNAK